MKNSEHSRRALLRTVATVGVAAVIGGPVRSADESRNSLPKVSPEFPRQEAGAVESVVSYAHFDFARVRELVDARPALARACWDWGFGDWESAIGAASHTGRREIAEYLISKGARPTMFTFAMLGDVDVIRAMVEARPGIQALAGPHGLSLLHHARSGGSQASAVVDYLMTSGAEEAPVADSGIPPDEFAKISGTYSFENAADDGLEILQFRDEVRIRRIGRVARRINRIEKYVYQPAGVPSVRIQFEETAHGEHLIVQDGAVRVTAVKRTD